MVVVEHLVFAYAGAREPAVDGLSFEIRPSEIFGLLGPSGAGKSTTQKVLIGLLRGYRGTVSVFDRNLAEWRGEYYERIGVSFELPNHFLKLTAIENLRYFRSLYGGATRSPRDLLDAVGLGDDGGMLVSQYSKGMKQRLGVARALLPDPDLIFLDEPTIGLDPVNARRIKDLIKREQEAGKTIFLTTHDMTAADELCDRVAFIVDGHISLIDKPRALKLRYGKHVVRVESQVDGRMEQSEFPLERLGHNEEFLAVLRRDNVQTLHTQEATLADVFIQVTGRGLS